MNIRELEIDAIIPYENNPRFNDGAVDAVAASIEEFGFKVPIVVDSEGVIVAGHTRYKAAKKLGLETVPCIVADDLSPEQVRAFRLADNKTGELAEWDIAALEDELLGIAMDMTRFGFDDGQLENDVDGTYTDKIEVPQYTITREYPPEIETLCNVEKYNDLIDSINKSNIPKKEKEFLKLAAARHLVFDYGEIAEYYAHASKDMQDLMEDSALVIIDYNDAIANGYVRIKSEFDEIRDMDQREGDDD